MKDFIGWGIVLPFHIVFGMAIWVLRLVACIPFLMPTAILALPVTMYANALGLHPCQLITRWRYLAYPYFRTHKYFCENIWKMVQKDQWYNLSYEDRVLSCKNNNKRNY